MTIVPFCADLMVQGQARSKINEVYTTTVATENRMYQLANVLRARAAVAST